MSWSTEHHENEKWMNEFMLFTQNEWKWILRCHSHTIHQMHCHQDSNPMPTKNFLLKSGLTTMMKVTRKFHQTLEFPPSFYFSAPSQSSSNNTLSLIGVFTIIVPHCHKCPYHTIGLWFQLCLRLETKIRNNTYGQCCQLLNCLLSTFKTEKWT